MGTDDNNYNCQNLYSKFISNFFLSLMIFTVLKRLLPISLFGTIIAICVSFTNSILILLKIIFKSKLKINYSFVVLAGIITILYTISCLNGVPFRQCVFYYAFTILGLLLLYMAYSIKDLSVLYDDFSKISIYITAFSLFIILVNRSDYSYNMRYSYILSIALYFNTIDLLAFKKLKNVPLIIIELLLIIIFGSRGPLLCYGIFLIAFVLFGNKKVSIKISFGLLITAICLNIERLLALITILMTRYKISSRTLYLLLNDFSHSSGRELIELKTIELIKSHPVIGLGIAGEFKYMEEYPHNIFYDLILHWGIVLGISVFIGLIYLIVKALFTAKNKEKYILLTFISYGFIALLFSGTYLSWDGFYILIGICLRIITNNKVIKNEK